MDSPAANTRSRSRPSEIAAGAPATKAAPPRRPAAAATLPRRNPPFLPTPTELALLASYPALLVFGAAFSLVSPQTRGAPFDAATQAHSQDPELAPSYFARKDNVVNTLFVKRGWGWVSAAFLLFLLAHPAQATTRRRVQGGIRWGLATVWWALVTQWCFGPALIDRGFRYTGGKCEAALEAGEHPGAFTAVACKSAGGRWRGGHDISGHVFLLVLGSFFLLQEVGWVAWRWRGERRDERSVVMHDGAVKSAEVEADRSQFGEASDALGFAGKAAAVVVALCWWMILMTAIYFHTWFEKLTGLLVALAGIYGVYILPRWVPLLRAVVGLPGI